MLNVRGRPAIVVGGDSIAAEKAAALAACGASVGVISPEFCGEMRELAARGQVTLFCKRYEPGDLTGAFVVVAATSDQQMIEAIWQETQQRGQPVNIVDVPRYCSFIVPSILRRGKLTVAVSTEGASPSVAKRIRQQLEENFPPTYEEFIDLAALARAYLRRQGVSYEKRDEFFRDFMASSILELLSAGKVVPALEALAGLLGAYGIKVQAAELAREFVQGEEYAPSKG
ncbi:MAG TPA: bifunctional precorrin-2 dehydrogenase/sirohydrochlorin ferrochelatase [Ktedonobacteraceae bacterium]|jgi:precorrin-2 dehydrogenase/sirohydrochlorin ferrochelatase|nr:bifunctional precorrin-2 dehydrogenase/sirohydrochlorin ferrochelatase [Ktedonobacteraceae bacterium]